MALTQKNGREFQSDNHYIPEMYMKNFACNDDKIYTYRTLVEHTNVSEWKKYPLKGISYRKHLYTSTITQKESDELENWFNHEIENPAKGAIQKAISGTTMRPDDWYRLIRYAAAQDIRTPARMFEKLKWSQENLQPIIQNSLTESIKKFEAMSQEESSNISTPYKTQSSLISITTDSTNDPSIKAEMLLGREYGLQRIKHELTELVKVLYQHKWTILLPPHGTSWFTTDNPVVRLNFTSNYKYDFGGGWNSPGSEILFPLSPQHLLYTQIGKKPLQRGSRLPEHQAVLIRRLMAEHAYCYIFAKSPDTEIVKLRPREVNPEKVHKEKKWWENWHEENKKAEKDLKG